MCCTLLPVQEIEQEAEAKRARKAAEAAFLQLLRNYTPSSAASAAASPAASPVAGASVAAAAGGGGVRLIITEDTTYEQAEEALQDLADWKVDSRCYIRMYAAQR